MYLRVYNCKNEWEPFSALVFKQVILKQKVKNCFQEIFVCFMI